MPDKGSTSSSSPSPYGSARDLPSFQEMERSIAGLKLMTTFVARDQRVGLLKVEREMHRIAGVVDRFYACLGPRNWIFHDLLSLVEVEELLKQAIGPDDAEQRFVALYRDREATKFWFTRLRNTSGLRERLHQIERAREHYDAGQFDSCVLHLIAVMDGFVNEFEPQTRKGLAARDPDDMTAWDSVVGHHMGLTNVLKSFTRTIKKRVDDEVYDVYRHGIVHGSIVRFDNVVVATKAWNMLFAVIDWATATEKSRRPTNPQPSFADIIRQVGANEHVKKELGEWKAASYSVYDDEFESHAIHGLTTQFMSAWRDSNYGELAVLQTRLLAVGKSLGEIAGDMRREFEGFDLTEFAVTNLESEAPAIWETRGTAIVNGQHGAFECRWIIEEENGELAYGSPSGKWRIVHCNPFIWRRAELQQ